MALTLEIILSYMKMPALQVWEKLRVSHCDVLSNSLKCNLYDEHATLATLSNVIAHKGKQHFAVTFTGGSIQYGHVRNYEHSLLLLEHCVQNIEDAWRWCEPFAATPSFTSARLYDDEYEYWQNATDPLEYTSLGRSYDHLPMKSNGMPPPMEQMEIDTSMNPGRRIIRHGYVEAIGAAMWFGPRFWDITGASRSEVIAQNWLRCRELPVNVIEIRVPHHLFTSAEGSSGKLQNDLRMLLFPNWSEFIE